jgi:hypothetical protein
MVPTVALFETSHIDGIEVFQPEEEEEIPTQEEETDENI